MLERANPVHLALALVATLGFVYGLWAHAWLWVIGSAAVALTTATPAPATAESIAGAPARQGRCNHGNRFPVPDPTPRRR
jgi:hypothetical protein